MVKWIGVTGHQMLSKRLVSQGATHSEETAWAWVEDAFGTLLDDQHQSIVVTSSLAGGADQRLSLVALDHGAQIAVVIPAQGLIETFESEVEKAAFRDLLAQAATVKELSNPEPSEEAYYEAGRWMVAHSDTIVAVWDGKKADGLGGTGDAVAFAIEQGKEVLQLDPIQRVVIPLSKGS